MPTAADYTAWAIELADLAEQAVLANRPLVDAWDAGPTIGGTLSTIIGAAVEDAVTEVGRVVWDLATLEAECRDRAAVCAQYAADLVAFDTAWDGYESQFGEYVAGGREGPAPVRPSAPSRPAAWADA